MDETKNETAADVAAPKEDISAEKESSADAAEIVTEDDDLDLDEEEEDTDSDTEAAEGDSEDDEDDDTAEDAEDGDDTEDDSADDASDDEEDEDEDEEAEDEEEEEGEEGGEAQEPTADTDTPPAADTEAQKAVPEVESELERLKKELEEQKRAHEAAEEKHRAVLKQYGFESDDDARAHAENVSLEEIQRRDAEAAAKAAKEADEAAKKADEAAKEVDKTARVDAAQFLAWEEEDMREILRAHPELSDRGIKRINELFNTEERRAAYSKKRGSKEARGVVSATDTYELVFKVDIARREAASAAQKAASKSHFQPSGGKNVKPAVTLPRHIREQRDLYVGKTDEEVLQLYKKYE